MKFKNWPATQQACKDGRLNLVGQVTATNIDGIPVLIVTPNPDQLQKAVAALGVQWVPFAHKPATVGIEIS